MPNSSRASTNAARVASSAPLSSNENRPDDPLEIALPDLVAGAVGEGRVEHRPDLRPLFQPLRRSSRRSRSCCLRRTAMVLRPREASHASSGDTACAEVPSGIWMPVVTGSGRGRAPSITSAWPPTYFVAARTADVDSGGDRREEQGRRPGIVEQRDDPAFAGDGADCRDVLHFHGQRPGAFEQDRARCAADQVGDPGADERIVVASRDAEAA